MNLEMKLYEKVFILCSKLEFIILIKLSDIHYELVITDIYKYL